MTLPVSSPQNPVAPDGDGNTTNPVASQPAAGTGGAGVTDYEALYKQALAEAQEFKNRWTGLQGKYNQEQQKWQGDATKLTTLETQLQEALGQRTMIETQFKTVQEEKNSTVGELETIRRQHERLSTIVKEYPSLLPFLSVKQGDKMIDLLPQGTGDELRTQLAAFATQIQTLGANANAANLVGSAPPSPQPASTPSADTVEKQMFAALRSGNQAEYDRLYNIWLEGQKK